MKETDKPDWATDFNAVPNLPPRGIRHILYHDVVGYSGWEATLEALADVAAIDGTQDPELVLRLQMLAALAKEKDW
ncbi:MAG: hypothetical protein HC818_08080 [Synechococcaceae cyanobacterium RM1_1_27]|nr:hypothetical protein [Synechococcaceae cyanobacterium RM1_1_27]